MWIMLTTEPGKGAVEIARKNGSDRTMVWTVDHILTRQHSVGEV